MIQNCERNAEMGGKAKEISAALLALGIGWILILNAAETVRAAEGAVMKCLTVIIPSLFGFMAIGGFLVRTGLYRLFGIPFGFISRTAFGLPAEVFAIFLISNTAGYPVGAVMLERLCKTGRISRRTAELSVCFCYSSGPAFIVGTVGISLFGNAKTGILLFISV